MPGIPNEIYNQLCRTLERCPQFADYDDLRTIFNNDLLTPWHNRLRRANSPDKQVRAVIGLLADERRRDTENALIIFLRVLSGLFDEGDELHGELALLAKKLDTALSGGLPTEQLRQEANSDGNGQEANPEGKPMLFIAADQNLLTCARSVARVSVPKIINGEMKQVPTGTGWLVTSQLALTCWHVIKVRGPYDHPIDEPDLQTQVANSLLTFDYTLPSQGIEYGVVQLEYYSPDLDYALLRLQERTDRPLQQWGFLRLDEYPPLTVQTQLFVIQHSKGLPQQRSAGFFVRRASKPNRILYDAPTEQGTSGAPVLNVSNWQVVALHNKNEGQLREGTLLGAILSDLRQNNPELHSEIMAA